ncbi:MAG: outer membrane beta-barrel protein [Bacteroidales bacterium]
MKTVKKPFVLAFALFLVIAGYAQEAVEKSWSVGINAGLHTGFSPMGNHKAPEIYEPGVLQIHGKKMFNDQFGVMAGVQYNLIDIDYNPEIHYVMVFAHGMTDLLSLMDVNILNNKTGVLVHAGLGMSGMWQQKGLVNPKPSRLFDGVDEMICVGGGLIPYYKVSDNLSVNLDYTYNLHIHQSRHFDMCELNEKTGINGRYMTFTVGVHYHF